ncbi:MAG: hypothetical protein COW89_09345 [Nitrospinae bacterium CG22_combo_CG10-13_8_21_14_all_47_10]|nr:MAG: hypothetical protein COW89_09345 [Nitrospinae bacterium CG22_combo_CG10-13_8_21_14_all_47_10]
MDFLTMEQVWAIAMFFLGSFILSTCSKWERDEQAILKDPRNRYGRRKSDIVKPKSLRGTIMTLAGTLLCLSGMILFLLHV